MELEARQDIAVRWELQREEGVDRRDLEYRGFGCGGWRHEDGKDGP